MPMSGTTGFRSQRWSSARALLHGRHNGARARAALRGNSFRISPGNWANRSYEEGMPTRNEIVAELTASGGEFPLEPIELNGVPMRVYKNAPGSLRDLFLSTRAFGERPFL